MKIPEQFKSACDSGLEYLKSQKSLNEAWDNCKDVQWMLWALRRLNYQDRKAYTLFACKCACDTPLPDGRYTYELLTDQRSRDAIEAAILYVHGKIMLEDMRAACAAAYAAAHASNSSYAAYAADSAVTYADDDVTCAVYAARAAADAAAYDAYAYAKEAQANFLREFIKWGDVEKHMDGML